MLNKYHNQFSNQEILDLVGISRQGFFKDHQRQQSVQHLINQVEQAVTEARKQSKRMGARALFYTYGVNFTGVNKFEKIVSDLGLGVAKRTKKRIITTDGVHEEKDVNLINGLCLTHCRQAIAGDITYFWSRGGLFYIFTLKDLYSGLILGLTGSKSLHAENAIITLREALSNKTHPWLKGTIHHTDAGSQYKSTAYKNLLAKKKLRMSIADNCLENGAAEQFNGLLKNDYLCFERIENVGQLNKELQHVKKFLNEVRKVKQLGFKSPVEFESAMMNLAPDQRKKKQLHDFKKGSLSSQSKASP